MNIICKYSGITLVRAPGLAKYDLADIHPIFRLPLANLLDIVENEWSPELQTVDKKLIFLSLAYNCELIKWRSAGETSIAVPSLGIIESAITNLVNIANWIDFRQNNGKFEEYPFITIDEENKELLTFGAMLKEIILNKDRASSIDRLEHRLKCLEANAKNLSSRCSVGENKNKALLSTTANWAMLVTNEALNEAMIGEEVRTYWKLILTTSPNNCKASGFSLADVEELKEFMIDNLPHGSVIAHDVICHIHSMERANQIHELGDCAILSARIMQVGASSETIQVNPPERAQFPTLYEFAKARATWLIEEAQRITTMEDLAKIEKTLAIKKGEGDEDDI